MELINGGGGSAAAVAVVPPAAKESKPVPKQAAVTSLATDERAKNEALLDKALRKIKQLKLELSKGLWVIGKEIDDIHEFVLWKARTNEKGKAKYASFKEFCNAELGFSPVWALKLIAINKYLTESDVVKHGATACAIMLEAPQEAMDDLRKQLDAEELKNNKELAKRVSQLRKEFGIDKIKRTGNDQRGMNGGKDEGPTTAKVSLPLRSQVLDVWAPPPAKGHEPQRATVADLAKGKCFAALDAGKVSVYVQVWLDPKTGLLKLGIKAQEPEDRNG